MTKDIKYLRIEDNYPIIVIGNNLTIEEDKMKQGKEYPFVYLNTKMIAFKMADGLIEIWQEKDSDVS